MTTPARVTTLAVLTLNIWGVPSGLSWPPRHVRFPRIRRFVEERADLDVVALQELWRTPLRPRALDTLPLVKPRADEGNSGLALHTRVRIHQATHKSYDTRTPLLELPFSKKGFQEVVLEHPTAGRLLVVNTHLQAYQGEDNGRMRARQIEAILRAVSSVALPVILCGDFNVYDAIAADQASLRAIASAGFVDAVAPFDSTPTYDLKDECERFDRIFVRSAGGRVLKPVRARVHLDARLADHRPVETLLEISDAART